MSGVPRRDKLWNRLTQSGLGEALFAQLWISIWLDSSSVNGEEAAAETKHKHKGRHNAYGNEQVQVESFDLASLLDLRSEAPQIDQHKLEAFRRRRVLVNAAQVEALRHSFIIEIQPISSNVGVSQVKGLLFHLVYKRQSSCRAKRANHLDFEIHSCILTSTGPGRADYGFVATWR